MENETPNVKKISADEALLSWDAPDFVHHERDVKWYILASIGFLGLLSYSVYIKDWFFIIIMVVVLVGIVAYLKTTPQIKHYSLSRTGLHIGEMFYPYDILHSFWIVYNNHSQVVNIIQNKKYVPAITIRLEEQDPLVVRKILGKYIPEDSKRGENMIDWLVRRLKF